jgi:hypothetical protein
MVPFPPIKPMLEKYVKTTQSPFSSTLHYTRYNNFGINEFFMKKGPVNVATVTGRTIIQAHHLLILKRAGSSNLA